MGDGLQGGKKEQCLGEDEGYHQQPEAQHEEKDELLTAQVTGTTPLTAAACQAALVRWEEVIERLPHSWKW
jgi:hypothetical protein